TWLVPSRKRVEYTFSDETTNACPSGAQLARPASLRWSCARVTAPLFTSTICTCPSGSLNAMRDPSGDHDDCMAAPVPFGSCRSVPLWRSGTQLFTDPERSDENASDLPSGDHAGSDSR